MACARKVSPLRIIGGGLLEKGCVSIAGTHVEQFIFADWYHEISPFFFAFAW